jgi:hypothetical protein
MFSPSLAPVRTIALRSVRCLSTTAASFTTSTMVGERAIIDRIAAPGTGKDRHDPMFPIDYMDDAHRHHKANSDNRYSTSTWIGERALVDRIAAPGTGKNRKTPMIPIDYYAHAHHYHTAAAGADTSRWVGEHAIIDRIAAPGTGINRKVPKSPIDYYNAQHGGRHYHAAVVPAGNTSTWISERALVDRIAAPGTGKNRKDPMIPIDFMEAARVHVVQA